MSHIREPGKFEGENEYAPYFYEQMLDGGVSHVWYTPNGTVDVFDVESDDVKKFPELRGVKRVAFLQTEQGFYTELGEPPTNEDLEHGWPDEGGGQLLIEERGDRYTLYLDDDEVEITQAASRKEAAREAAREGADFPLSFLDRRGGAHEIDEDGKITYSW